MAETEEEFALEREVLMLVRIINRYEDQDDRTTILVGNIRRLLVERNRAHEALRKVIEHLSPVVNLAIEPTPEAVNGAMEAALCVADDALWPSKAA